MKPDIQTCKKITAILRRHNLNVERLSSNRKNGRTGIDGATKIQVVTEIRAKVGDAVTLEELAAYINISPSKISHFTDLTEIS